MSAGSPFFPPLQSQMPQFAPPMFPEMENSPIRRFSYPSFQYASPDFQRMGFGALAMPAQFAYTAMQQQLAQRSSMMLGPAGGSATSYARSMRQMEDLNNLRQLSNAGDAGRIRQVISALTNAAYKGEDPNKINNLTQGMTNDYIKLLNTGMGQALGLEDWLAPGGLSSGFSERMYMAGMRNRQAPGKMGLSVDQVQELTQTLRGRMFKNGREDFGFTRGFNMREFGEMAEGMAQRGVLDFSKDRGRMMNQFKEMAGALDALKDLIGNPDAPIPELMQTLDSMFGGAGLASMPAAKLEMMVRQAQEMGDIMNLTGTALAEVFRASTQQAKGLGMRGELGPIATLRAMPVSEAAQQLQEEQLQELPQGDRIRLGMMSPQERMQTTQSAVLRTMNSQFTDRLAAMMALRRDVAGGKFQGNPQLDRMEELAHKMETGKPLTPDEGQWLYQNFRSGKFEGMMKGAGINDQTINAVLRNRLRLDEEKANTDFTGASLTAYRAQTVEKMGAKVMGSQTFQELLGLGQMAPGARAGRAQGFLNEMLSGSMSEGQLRKRMAASLGIAETDPRLGAAVLELQSNANTLLDTRITGPRALEGWQQMVGDQALARQDENRTVAESRARFNRVMANAGFGRSKTGTAGMMDNLLRSLAENPNANITELAAQTMGGLPTDRLVSALGTPEAVGKLQQMKNLTTELRDMTKELGTADADRRKEIERNIEKKQKELEVTRTLLSDYEVYVKAGTIGMANKLSGAAAETGAVARGGSELEKVRMLQELAKGQDITQSRKEASLLKEGDQKSYLGMQGEISKLAQKALETDDPKAQAAALKRIQELQRKGSEMFKQASDVTMEEGAKEIQDRQEARKAQLVEEQVKAMPKAQEQEATKALAAASSPTVAATVVDPTTGRMQETWEIHRRVQK